MNETLGQRIERHRKAARLGQKELGHLVGLSESGISNLESGKVADLKLPAGIKMAEVFGITVEELQGTVPPRGIGAAVLPGLVGHGVGVFTVSEETVALAEIGRQVVELVSTRQNIVPGPLIRTVC